MSFAVYTHVAIGAISLLIYWALLLGKKGTDLHRSAGKYCLGLIVITGVLVAPILFLRPAPFDPGYVVQMIYLTTCLVIVSMLAFYAIRFRNQIERFRGRWFQISGPILLLLGFVVLSAGLVKGDTVAIVLSWVGLTYGAGMIAFARYQGPFHPRWWMSWHLNAVTGLFNAVNGTFLYVAARWLGAVSEGQNAQVAFQLLTIVGAVSLRVWFGRKYKAPIFFNSARAS